MDTSRIIHAPVSVRRFAVTAPITQYDYGYLLLPEGVELPTIYEIDFSNDEKKGTSLTVYGGSEGAEVPEELIRTGKDVYAFYYFVGDGFGKTEFTWKIPNNCRPSRDGQTPTPTQQSSIDQLIVRSNEAVESAEQSASAADQSARESAESARASGESALSASNSALSSGEYASNALGYAESASASATASANSASASAQIKADVEGLVDDTQASANASAQSASASANSASQAQGFAQSASASAQSASGYASNAQTSANTASNKASEASTSAQTASSKASEASQSASQALSYKTDAESAKTASQTAQGLAESARDSAVQAKTDAESAKTASQTAQGLAESARDSAVQAKTDAESAKADAESARDEAQQAVASISGALADKAPVITDTASGSIASFSDGADDLPLKSLVVDINPIQDLSHGDPSPENLCPISGWAEVDVEQSGKNLLALPVLRFNEVEATKANCFFVKAGTYMLQYSCDAEHRYGIRLLDMAGNVISDDAHKPNPSVPYNSSAQAYYAGINVPSGFKTAVCNIVENCYVRIVSNQTGGGFTNAQFEKGSTATPYEPYTGRSITIQLGQTVYGGKLDVLSGELVIDRAMVDLGTIDNWRYSQGNTGAFDTIVALTPLAKSNTKCICSQYKTLAYPNLGNITNSDFCVGINKKDDGTVYTGTYVVGTLFVKDIRYSDVDTFKSAMNGVMLCYELAEPIEIQLSPNQINSLYGVNNLWADSGDSEVVYRADTKLYIERLTAPDSADMIADANITSGKYFMVGNSLYKATANIANGSAIIVGTNCIRKSLSEALNEINA